jgi:hypothetical protein
VGVGVEVDVVVDLVFDGDGSKPTPTSKSKSTKGGQQVISSGQGTWYLATVDLIAPAEADIQRLFGVTPPSVHSMIIELERRGLISRVPRQPRSIGVSVPEDDLPRLRQPIKTTGARYSYQADPRGCPLIHAFSLKATFARSRRPGAG